METEHSEYRFRAEASDTVVVFIHGIQGSPSQFDYLIEKLNGRYSVENLLLPGHGGTVGDFAQSHMDQWQDYVDTRIRQMQRIYKNILLAGHSMGCLLAVQTALSHPDRIRGLFLISMPLRIRITFPYIRNNLAAAFNWEDGDVVSAARKGNSISASSPLAYLKGAPRYIELFDKSRKTRGLIEKLQLPIIMVQPEYDEIVSRKSLRYTAGNPNVQVIAAKNSGHYYYPKGAQEQITEALIRFISEVTETNQQTEAEL